MAIEDSKLYQALAMLGMAGLVGGMGALLASRETLTWRMVIGRAMSSVTLGVAATALIVVKPAAGLCELIGVACLIGSLGTSGLERLAKALISRLRP